MTRWTSSRILRALLVVFTPVLAVSLFLSFFGDRFPGARETLAAIKAAESLDIAETEYLRTHGQFGTLADLESDQRSPVRAELERARSAGYQLRLTLTAEGYDISAWPVWGEGWHSLFSDRNGFVRIRIGPGRADASDPAIGDPIQLPSGVARSQ